MDFQREVNGGFDHLHDFFFIGQQHRTASSAVTTPPRATPSGAAAATSGSVGLRKVGDGARAALSTISIKEDRMANVRRWPSGSARPARGWVLVRSCSGWFLHA